MEEKKIPKCEATEKALLGCFFLDRNSFDESLSEDDFYNQYHVEVFRIMRNLIVLNMEIDFVTIKSGLEKTGNFERFGGDAFIISLIETNCSLANVWSYVKILKEKNIERKALEKVEEARESILDNKLEHQELMLELEKTFFEIAVHKKKKDYHVRYVLEETLKILEDKSRGINEIDGLRTGFPELDNKLLGLQAGQLIIIAARPGIGKSALALNIAKKVYYDDIPVIFFSLEMNLTEIGLRCLSQCSNIPLRKLKMKDFREDDLKSMAQAITTLGSRPFFIKDDITSFNEIKSYSRQLKSQEGLGLIVVDYLQLISPISKMQNREQQISEISRSLKLLAKELECPIICLSQLNRRVENSVDKRPNNSDLRESGAIEQDADIILLLYRDDMYNPNSIEKGLAEIIIGKNRNGETGFIKVKWQAETTSFLPLTSGINYKDDF